MIIAVNYFRSSEYAPDFEYASVLNMSGLWIYQSCEYAMVLNIFLILNMSGFWIYHSFNYVRVTKDSVYTWICRINSWICLIILECAKTAWIAFVLYLLTVIPYLKEPLTVFLESKNLIFSIVAGSIRFRFLFQTEYFYK